LVEIHELQTKLGVFETGVPLILKHGVYIHDFRNHYISLCNGV